MEKGEKWVPGLRPGHFSPILPDCTPLHQVIKPVNTLDCALLPAVLPALSLDLPVLPRGAKIMHVSRHDKTGRLTTAALVYHLVMPCALE